jgi:hypothetical protein
MPENTLTSSGPIDIFTKRKRSRCDSTSSLSSNSPPIQRTLELDGVIEVLKEYESIEGNDINCCMCGEYILSLPSSFTSELRAKVKIYLCVYIRFCSTC